MGYPALSARFFQEQRPSREFFARVKDRGPWNENLVPLYEWDGRLFVGFSGPEPEATNQPDWCLVRSEAEPLTQLFTEFQTPQEPAKPAPNLPPPPSLDSEFSIELLDSASSKDIPVVADPIDELVLESEDQRHASVSNSPKEHVNLNILFSDTNVGTQAVTPPPAPEGIELTPIPDLHKQEVATIQTREAPKKIAVEKIEQAVGERPASPPQDREWTALWQKLHAHYDHGMICLLQQKQILPWKWDQSLDAARAADENLSIDEPSPFRIAARTQKSYHGYIVQNPTTDAFFKMWTNGAIPEHLTVTPLLAQDIVIGFLVAWGSKKADSEEALQLNESSAENVAILMKRKTNTSAAA